MCAPAWKRFNTLTHPHIHRERFLSDFVHLGEIGVTPQGGVDRPSYSAAHLQALAWFREYVARMGLAARVDTAGNHSVVLPGDGGPGQTLLIAALIWIRCTTAAVLTARWAWRPGWRCCTR